MDMRAFLHGEIPEVVEESRIFSMPVAVFCLVSLSVVRCFLKLKNLCGFVGNLIYHLL